MKTRILAIVGVSWLLVAGSGGFAKPPEDVVVNARVFNGYTRTKLANGTYKPEYYGFGEGGRWNGTKVDSSLDDLPFVKIARTLVGPLRTQGYLPATDPKGTDLLILVYWGVTTGAENGDYDHGLIALSAAMNAVSSSGGLSSASDNGALNSALMFQRMENRAREQNNLRNADILGYTDAYLRAEELRQIGFAAGDQPIWELEANRYFVVLKAFDFPYALKEKKLRLLWEARFSIYERGNNFDEQLLAMTRTAAKYFGEDTHGLVRHDVPQGKVEVGTPTVVEDATSGGEKR